MHPLATPIAHAPSGMPADGDLAAVLEMAVALEQAEPLGELYVTWTGAEEGEVVVGDDYSGRPAEKKDDD